MSMNLKMIIASCLVAAPASVVAVHVQAAQAEEQLKEVVVRAARLKAAELRKQIVDKENQFYAKYNELNTRDDFDVLCRTEARTGTRLERRLCRGMFEENAITTAGKAAFLIRQDIQNQIAAGARVRLPGSPPAPAVMEIEAQRPAFQAHMRRVVADSDELSQLLEERANLAEQYRGLGARASPEAK